jgi:cell division protein FtsB
MMRRAVMGESVKDASLVFLRANNRGDQILEFRRLGAKVFTKYASLASRPQNFPFREETKQRFTGKIETALNGLDLTVNTRQTAADPLSFSARLKIVAYSSRHRIATILAIGLASLLAYHVIFGSNGLTAYQQKRNEDRVLQKQIVDLQQENNRLKEHVENLNKDPDTIEHEARMILHYARPGEVIYKLQGSQSSGAPR